VLVWGAYLISTGSATVGAVTTVTLYAVQVIPVIGELIFWLDEIQVGGASLARIVGVQDVAPDRVQRDGTPADESLAARGVRYAYREGHDVLHGVDLDLRVGERLAVVGPSGAGKSTLGRMLAGIHPPTGGQVAVGGVPLVDLPLDDLRGHVALVTQEHHVFVGSVADNLRLARPGADDRELVRALRAVDAWGWVSALPEGLATAVGSGGAPLSPAQAQQLALARLVLLDPHTLVLDEATSLLDPRAARHLERSLSAVLEGRTVVAIAHRLHTAHDADRVAVVDAGRITEIGSHDELVAAGGEYAALWHSWQRD
jgi:ABC-type multidrug transport system fused ATPase/permease subunit